MCSSESKKTFTGFGSVRNRRNTTNVGDGASGSLRQTTFELLSGLTLGRGLEEDARAGPPAQQGRALDARRVDALLQTREDTDGGAKPERRDSRTRAADL
jgi:hypothetical protein